jgi:hypothetical protein
MAEVVVNERPRGWLLNIEYRTRFASNYSDAKKKLLFWGVAIAKIIKFE